MSKACPSLYRRSRRDQLFHTNASILGYSALQRRVQRVGAFTGSFRFQNMAASVTEQLFVAFYAIAGPQSPGTLTGWFGDHVS
jgi:hypothetical protein